MNIPQGATRIVIQCTNETTPAKTYGEKEIENKYTSYSFTTFNIYLCPHGVVTGANKSFIQSTQSLTKVKKIWIIFKNANRYDMVIKCVHGFL
jgi:hypothetical protein